MNPSGNCATILCVFSLSGYFAQRLYTNDSWKKKTNERIKENMKKNVRNIFFFLPHFSSIKKNNNKKQKTRMIFFRLLCLIIDNSRTRLFFFIWCEKEGTGFFLHVCTRNILFTCVWLSVMMSVRPINL